MSSQSKNIRNQTILFIIAGLVFMVGIVTIGLSIAVVNDAFAPSKENQSSINSFNECAAAGNPVQESYPEVCVTSDGERFVNN